MLRRFSTKYGFHRDSKESRTDGQTRSNGAANGVSNGYSNGAANGTTNGTANGTTNGTTNGSAAEKPSITKRSSMFASKQKKENGITQPSKPQPNESHHGEKREDVESSFEQFAQLVHASQRPLPTQTGDGTYIEHPESSGLFSDLKVLGVKDAQTLMTVMKTKATGALTDDRTYLMEKVIQVSLRGTDLKWAPC